VNIGAFSQDCVVNTPPRPNTIVGYYQAYKYNLQANDLSKLISPSITHLNYIAFDPNDLTSGTGPYTVFTDFQHYNKFNQFRDYLVRNPNRKFQLILSVLLPTTQDLVKISPFSNLVTTGQYNQNNTFVSDLVKIVNDHSLDGIDIDYPNKLPCYPPPPQGIPQGQQFTTNELNSVFIPFLNDLSSQLKKSNSSKILTVTAGQYPISGLNSSNSGIINFVNIQAIFRKFLMDGIVMSVNQNSFWESIIELVTSSNIITDINSQNLVIANDTNTQYPFADDKIQSLCGPSVYATLSWKNFSNLLLLCDTSTNKDPKWNYGFDNTSQQPYLYQQQNSPTRYYYVSYENLQSLKSKLDYVRHVNALGIAIFDITKDTVDGTLMNFISVINPPNSSSKPMPTTSSTSQSSPSNVGAIVGGVIGSLTFVSVLVAAGFILYRRKHNAGMAALLIDTNNQACSDTNSHVYSDINRQ
ncbi:26092_t:CDS:2, partial [Racocetra persica]